MMHLVNIVRSPDIRPFELLRKVNGQVHIDGKTAYVDSPVEFRFVE